jgi:signal transduction histidine kinase
MEVLDSIRQLHALSDQVTTEAFEEIVRKGMIYQRRILGAYGFAQRIGHDVRGSFEAQAPGRAIVRSDGEGGVEPMPPLPTYYPLTYQTPPGGLGIPLGYDFAARREERAAIASMLRFGVFALGGSPPGAPGDELYMFAPIVYGGNLGEKELVGFAVGLFRPRQVLEAALGEAARGVRARMGPSEGGGGEASVSDGPAEWSYAREFSLANQEWRFAASADRAYWEAERSRAPALLAGGGTSLALALAGALWWMAGRSRRVEALVLRRTAELAEANRRIEASMEERRELEDEVLRIAGREKARVGRDLHDSLGQKLTGAMYLFGAYRQRTGGGDAEAERSAEQIAATLKESVSQIRRIARGLAPVALTEDGLPDALRRLAEESSALFGKSVEFYAEREGRPKDAATAEHLYLIAQEALNNAAKHGGAGRVVMSLDYDAQGGLLAVEDDGRGFAATRAPDREGGSGLRIMRHRCDVFGGRLELGGAPGGGARVACRFPAADQPS